MTIDDDATSDDATPADDLDDLDGEVAFEGDDGFEDEDVADDAIAAADRPADEDEIYDAETLERINRTRPSPRPAASRRRRHGAAGAIVAAMLMGVGDVLDPQRRVEIEMVDPWSGEGNGSSRVRLSWDPVPSRTVARIVE